jgi:dihydrolipoamide dehydrogenase
MEPFAAEIIATQLRGRGVELHLRTSVTGVSRPEVNDAGEGLVHGGELQITLSDGTVLVADELVVATGRVPNSAGLGLESVGVSANPHGYIDVDDHMTVPGTDWLYVVGDLSGRALLTHMGKYQARIAGDVIVARAAGRDLDDSRFTDVADHGAVTQVTFTDPAVASVGLTSDAAHKAGIDVETVEYDTSQVAGAALFVDEYVGRAQLVIDRATDTVVGATFVGPAMAELLHSATIAVVGKVPVSVLWHAVPSYPTVSEIWLRLLETLRRQRTH